MGGGVRRRGRNTVGEVEHIVCGGEWISRFIGRRCTVDYCLFEVSFVLASM